MSPHFELTWRHKLEILFDGMCDGRMFETRAEIREATRRKIYEIAYRESFKIGQREARERIRSELEAHGIVLPPETAEKIFSNMSD